LADKKILEEREDGWSLGDLNGYEGLFPSNYINKTDNSEYAELQNQEIQNLVEDEETKRKKLERRSKLKEQYKQAKQEVQQKEKLREQLEKEIKALSEKKQKLTKDLREKRAKTSDLDTIFYDLLKLSSEIDILNDAITEIQQNSRVSFESLTQFVTEFPKEGKISSALNPFVSKMVPKMKDLLKLIENSSLTLEECERAGKEVNKDLEILAKVIHP